jgi:amidase
LAAAGCEIEEVEPPHFEEGAFLWRQMVMDDMRRGGQPAMEAMADAGTQSALRGYMDGLSALDRDQTLDMQMRRFNICRDWAVFFEQYPVLLMPNSWQRQFQIDADKGGPDQVQQLLAAQAPLLGTAMMGLPGLSVPTGVVNGLPVGVQLVTGRFREDLALRAGEMIEQAAGYAVLDHLAPV